MEDKIFIIACNGQMLYIGKIKEKTDAEITMSKPLFLTYKNNEKTGQFDLGLTSVLPGINPEKIILLKNSVTFILPCEEENIIDLYTQATTGIVKPSVAEKKAILKRVK